MGKRAGRVCGGCLITTFRKLELLIDATKHASGFQTSSKDSDTATNSHPSIIQLLHSLPIARYAVLSVRCENMDCSMEPMECAAEQCR